MSYAVYRWKSVDVIRAESRAKSRTQSASVRVAHWDLQPNIAPISEINSEDSQSITTSDSTIGSQSNGRNERRHLKLNLSLFLISLICSLIYIMFPVLNANGNTNYFVYYMGKAAFWAFFGIGAFVEQMEACLPGSSDELYVYAYIIAFIAPPITHLIVYFAYFPLTTVPSFNMFAVATSQLSIMFIYGIWQYIETQCINEVDTRVTVFDIITDNSITSNEPLHTIEKIQDGVLSSTTNPMTLQQLPNHLPSTDNTASFTTDAANKEGWVYVIPTYVKVNRLLPRYFILNTDSVKKPRIIASNRLLHFILTCVYYLEWFLLSYLLIVSITCVKYAIVCYESLIMFLYRVFLRNLKILLRNKSLCGFVYILDYV